MSEDWNRPEDVVHSNTSNGTEVSPELAPSASPEPDPSGQKKQSRVPLIQAIAALITAVTGLLALILTVVLI
ncbi:hypothetical protein [Streptomyces microflavus]|uniref:hypothetical protein n=1 Tax=Streptomyces microflavus TaxID=1919 RepID=UPI0033206165